MSKKTSEWVCEAVSGRVDNREKNGRVHEWMSEGVNEQVDKWKNERVNERMSEWISKCMVSGLVSEWEGVYVRVCVVHMIYMIYMSGPPN